MLVLVEHLVTTLFLVKNMVKKRFLVIHQGIDPGQVFILPEICKMSLLLGLVIQLLMVIIKIRFCIILIYVDGYLFVLKFPLMNHDI